MSNLVTPKRYMQLDSTYRNRISYPYPASFSLKMITTPNSSDAFNAADPISEASIVYPNIVGKIFVC